MHQAPGGAWRSAYRRGHEGGADSARMAAMPCGMRFHRAVRHLEFRRGPLRGRRSRFLAGKPAGLYDMKKVIEVK